MESSINIILNSNPQIGDTVIVSDALRPSVPLRIVFSTTPSIDSVVIGSTINATLANLSQYVQNTWNYLNHYIVATNFGTPKTLGIVARIENSQFAVTSNTTQGRVTTAINNVAPPLDYEITGTTILQSSSNPCQNVDIRVTTSIPTNRVSEPIIQNVANLSDFTITVPRREGINVTVHSNESNSRTATRTNINVPELLAARFTLDVLLAPNGGTLNVTNDYDFLNIVLQYSLNDVDFFNSNSFSGIAQGNHTVYIRDNIGCKISIPFSIGAFTPNLETIREIREVSNLNSFRFKLVQDLNTNIPNITNTLSFEERTEINSRNYTQPFQKNDGLIRTQIKSSYSTNTAVLVDCQGNETTLTVSKRSNNLNITDVRDGRVRSVPYSGNNYVGVQYGSGNTYNPNTLVDTGDYNLGVSLPSWVNVGDYLNVQGQGWFRVIDIFFHNNIQTAILNLLVSDFNTTIPVQGLSRRITSVYNQQQYELYEFDVNMANLSGKYQVRINLSDTRFTDVAYLSEVFDVKEKHECTHLFQWYDTKNTEINYNTGIRGKARFPYIYNMKWSPNVEQDVYMSDTRTILLESRVREFYIIQLRELPTAMAQKVMLVFSQNRLFIDGLSFVKETESEVTRFGGNNVYQITQQLTRSDYVFETGSSDIDIIDQNAVGLFVDGNESGLLLIN